MPGGGGICAWVMAPPPPLLFSSARGRRKMEEGRRRSPRRLQPEHGWCVCVVCCVCVCVCVCVCETRPVFHRFALSVTPVFYFRRPPRGLKRGVRVYSAVSALPSGQAVEMCPNSPQL